MSVRDAFVASVSAGADLAKSWTWFAGDTIIELEIAALPSLREGLGGA